MEWLGWLMSYIRNVHLGHFLSIVRMDGGEEMNALGMWPTGSVLHHRLHYWLTLV